MIALLATHVGRAHIGPFHAPINLVGLHGPMRSNWAYWWAAWPERPLTLPTRTRGISRLSSHGSSYPMGVSLTVSCMFKTWPEATCLGVLSQSEPFLISMYYVVDFPLSTKVNYVTHLLNCYIVSKEKQEATLVTKPVYIRGKSICSWGH